MTLNSLINSALIAFSLYVSLLNVSLASNLLSKNVVKNTMTENTVSPIILSEFEKQIKNGKISEFVESKSLGVTGMYGEQNKVRKSYLTKISSIEFGNFIFKNEKVNY
jgi:hypothetical protein